LTGGADKLLKIFDLHKPSAEPATFNGAPQPIKAAQFLSTDENLICSIGGDQFLRWKVK
jgi:hypothetical protein